MSTTENHMDMIEVVCGVIFDLDKVLVCRRKPGIILGGYWEFPGGKVEPNERMEDTLTRELMEELAMKVEVISHFKTNEHDYDGTLIRLISFRCRYISSELRMTDHDKLLWIHPGELAELEFAPADVPIVNEIVKYG